MPYHASHHVAPLDVSVYFAMPPNLSTTDVADEVFFSVRHSSSLSFRDQFER